MKETGDLLEMLLELRGHILTRQVVEDLDKETQGVEIRLEGLLVVRVGGDLSVGSLLGGMRSAPASNGIARATAAEKERLTSNRVRKGVAKVLSTWLISTYRSSDRYSGRQRWKMECATSSTPLLIFALSGERRETRSATKVSHLSQKSESAIKLIASPSCVWMVGGQAIMRPISSCLMVTTSSSGSKYLPLLST